MRVLRVLRPLRAINRAKGLKVSWAGLAGEPPAQGASAGKGGGVLVEAT